ncbi:MAG: AAA family ATPase [Clostridiales bacterium]|jgi:predicted ATPase|nr:AAA family ATPase [Clostridiales bacterium]
MIRRIKIANFLSFGSDCEEISIKGLNVVIGNNGVGKTCFIEAIDLLRKAPSFQEFSNKLRKMGDNLLHRGPDGRPATLEFSLDNMDKSTKGNYPELLYKISFVYENQMLRISEEKLTGLGNGYEYQYYDSNNGMPRIRVDNEMVDLGPDRLAPCQSFLSFYKTYLHYPVIAALAAELEKIKIYRNWTFGSETLMHQPQKTDVPRKFLEENFSNIPLVLNSLEFFGFKNKILEHLQYFYPILQDYFVNIERGVAQVYFREKGLSAPVSQLSDGLLHYLCLICILLNPDAPPLICIETPEVGLHPDILARIGNITKEASISRRCRIIVTTHSTDLVNALTSSAGDVLFAEKGESGTRIARKNKEKSAFEEGGSVSNMWTPGPVNPNMRRGPIQ